MKKIILPVAAAATSLLTGCETIPPGAERGPDGTMAYTVVIEASEPGARVEANGESIGNTPISLKIYGDPDGTFHDFGSDYYIVRGLPTVTNQYAQTRVFGTGRWFGPEDRIPQRIYFDMNQPQQEPVRVYGSPPPAYYYPSPYYYYGPYYGPRFYFGFGHGHHGHGHGGYYYRH